MFLVILVLTFGNLSTSDDVPTIGNESQKFRISSYGGPVVEGWSEDTYDYAASYEISKAADIVANELLLMLFMADNAAALPEFEAVEGWNMLNEVGGGEPDCNFVVYWRIATGGESATETVTVENANDAVGWYIRVSGVDTADPIHKTGSDCVESGSSSLAITGVTTENPNCLVFYGNSFDGGDGFPYSVAGDGWVESDDAQEGTGGGDASGSWGTKEMESAGASGTATVSASISDGMAGFQFAINVDGNEAPINDHASSCVNIDTGDGLYARNREYIFTSNHSDGNGYVDIDYIDLSASNGSVVWKVRYDVGDTIFSEITQTDYFILDTVNSEVTTDGDEIHVTWLITFEWLWDATDCDLISYVVDIGTLDDTDVYDTNYNHYGWLNATMTLDDGSGTADRGDYNTLDSIVAAGDVHYQGTSFDADSAVVDVLIIHNDIDGSPWIDETLTSGAYSMTVDSEEGLGISTYVLKVVYEGDGVGGIDLLGVAVNDTYIADRISIGFYVIGAQELGYDVGTNSYDYALAYTESVEVFESLYGYYDYDDVMSDGTITWNDTVGVIAGGSMAVKAYKFNLTDNEHGITKYYCGPYGEGENSSVRVFWDNVTLPNGPAYKWFQYSPDEVWFIIDTGLFLWETCGDAVADIKIMSTINGTDDDWGITNSAGYLGDLILGDFDSSWYHANIKLYAQDTLYDSLIWSVVVVVDILHSMQIRDSTFYLTDDWVTVGFQINWNNGTFFIWDNITGTPVFIGASYMGLYQFAKSATIGAHNLIILVNGTHGTLSEGSQVAGTTDTDSWEYLEFTYTVNPIIFSITDPFAMQNNETIIFSAMFYTGDLTIDYTIYEDGVGLTSGTLNIPSSGSYYVLKWDKSSSTSVANWTVVLQSSSTNITIFGYNYIVDSAEYTYNSSGYFQGDTVYMEADAAARANEEMWNTLGLIILILFIPVVAGVAVKTDRAGRLPRGKRDKTLDKIR